MADHGRRVTRCFTYGETRREHVTIPGGCVTLASYVTACGGLVHDDYPGDPPSGPWYGKRPPKVCPRCWADARRAWSGATTAKPEAAAILRENGDDLPF